ncbi:ribosome assembly factor SBDS [Methanococcus aeolicus]|jgi:ribosome maturation protein SDO1|uniref:Shwachman-Bodian-Diamond syndrome protein n=1 Tax=Methanococcus aeolicus (strain ATCC BAA-1280 / DSM 17508 / OCM 812 / Nankai-3) TaxID=419665 RepID=A6UTF0_META3|nr:ribosome assembly factor SBDS [Methanococcus aeolicus]ABR55772.1 Shwachman-Bodian-Diamond syndrome protein [Methanococcus aeolicus Nankai-3]UXM84123.1 ribosome assembly factor SBDS [Methanococcus aeolicus]
MVPLEKAVIARLQSHGEKFEVLVDPYLSAKFKEGQKLDISEILASEDIYKDSGKGEKVPDELLEKIFGTTDKKEVAKKIVLKGTVQLTSQQRKEMKEQKRKQIISLIARNTINPQTDTPHPPNRIEKVMEEIRANIDIYKSAEEQIPDIIKDIRRLIPIKFEKRDLAVRIPAEYSTTAYHSVSNYGTIKKEEWQSDGSLVFVIEIPSGIETEFYGHLNKITKGNVQTKILKRY